MADIHKSTLTVGPVLDEGSGARRILSVGAWNLSVFEDSQDEPRIRDLDLAERLGYAKRHNIRDLIRGLIKEGKLKSVTIIRVARMIEKRGATRGVERREEEEFWLTEAQALKVIAKSATPIADQLLDEIIEVFRLAIRGLLAPDQARSAEVRLAMFLLTERQHVERFLSTKFIASVSKLYGREHRDGERPPQFFRMVAEKVYKAVFGTEVHAEMQARGDKRQYYQFLTDGAHQLARHDLDKIDLLARQSMSPPEFWARVEAEYHGAALQGRLFS